MRDWSPSGERWESWGWHGNPQEKGSRRVGDVAQHEEDGSSDPASISRDVVGDVPKASDLITSEEA